MWRHGRKRAKSSTRTRMRTMTVAGWTGGRSSDWWFVQSSPPPPPSPPPCPAHLCPLFSRHNVLPFVETHSSSILYHFISRHLCVHLCIGLPCFFCSSFWLLFIMKTRVLCPRFLCADILTESNEFYRNFSFSLYFLVFSNIRFVYHCLISIIIALNY